MDTVTVRVETRTQKFYDRSVWCLKRSSLSASMNDTRYYSSSVLDKVDMIEIATSGTSMSARYRDREITWWRTISRRWPINV